jgi:hypothetical protein
MPKGNIEHGEYLVERVVMCYECHSTRDERGNLVASTNSWAEPMPMRPPWPANWPETIPRIAGLPGYTDELAMRLLTQGAGQARRHAAPSSDAGIPHDAAGCGGRYRLHSDAITQLRNAQLANFPTPNSQTPNLNGRWELGIGSWELRAENTDLDCSRWRPRIKAARAGRSRTTSLP